MSFLILQGIFALLWPFFIINTPEYCMNLTEEDRIAFSGRHSQQPQPAAMQPVYYLSSAPDHAQASVALNCGAKDWNAYLCCEMLALLSKASSVLCPLVCVHHSIWKCRSTFCSVYYTEHKPKNKKMAGALWTRLLRCNNGKSHSFPVHMQRLFSQTIW